MKKSLFFVLLFGYSVAFSQTAFNQTATVEAANKLLASLNEPLKAKMNLSFADKDRKEWSNLPLEQVERLGVRMDDLSDAQRLLVHELLRTVLSQQGYQKTMFIMQYDDGIKERMTKAKNPIARRYSHEHYWVTIFGTPSATGTWAWQFEGHHISFNLTHSPKGVSCTPMFTGVNPALITEGVRAGEYVMADENEGEKWLFNSFSKDLKKKAVVDTLPSTVDVMAQKGTEPFLKETKGVSYNELNAEQRKAVQKIVKAWVFNMNEDIATEKWARISKSLSQSYIVYLGDGNVEHLHYYRIVSPVFSIERTNRDGGIMHLHTLWRDLGDDFGAKL